MHSAAVPLERVGAMRNLSAWAVHVLTASGAALALLAAFAAAARNWQAVFLLLGVAMIVDGIDGPLARRLRVAERLPWFYGARLDLVVDYATYVLVPALVVALSALLSQPLAIVAAVVIAVVGVIYFGDSRMKTAEASFRGFPAVWNVVVFQLMVYKLPELVTLLIIAACAVATFTPLEFVHPLRVRRLRPLTIAMAVAWSGLALVALAADLDPGPATVAAFAVVSLYFAVIGIVLQITRA